MGISGGNIRKGRWGYQEEQVGISGRAGGDIRKVRWGYQEGQVESWLRYWIK